MKPRLKFLIAFLCVLISFIFGCRKGRVELTTQHLKSTSELEGGITISELSNGTAESTIGQLVPVSNSKEWFKCGLDSIYFGTQYAVSRRIVIYGPQNGKFTKKLNWDVNQGYSYNIFPWRSSESLNTLDFDFKINTWYVEAAQKPKPNI